MQLKCLLIILVCFFAVGFVNRVFADSPIAINEVLVHPVTGSKEWVEFATDGTDLTNYWIDDDTDFISDAGGSSKKQITGAVAGIDTHHVVFELSSSMFNNDGDTVALFSPDGQLLDHYQYTSDPGVDISIGRTPDSTGPFTVLPNATRGSANSKPKPTETPTPEPTSKPQKEPKATATPNAKATSSSVTTSTNSTSDNTAPDDGYGITNAAASFDAPSNIGSPGAHPTSILGTATKAAEKKGKTTPTPEVLVKGSSSSTMPMMLLSFGGLFLLSCGILIYLKKKGIWNRE